MFVIFRFTFKAKREKKTKQADETRRGIQSPMKIARDFSIQFGIKIFLSISTEANLNNREAFIDFGGLPCGIMNRISQRNITDLLRNFLLFLYLEQLRKKKNKKVFWIKKFLPSLEKFSLIKCLRKTFTANWKEQEVANDENDWSDFQRT